MYGWTIGLFAFGYIALLFAVAAYGDRRGTEAPSKRPRRYIYALSLAVYCTSWTFFGSVGVASIRGFEYFGIFLGPILVYTFGMPFVRRMITVAKAERITSIADFLGSRYGKSGTVAALAAIIAVIGTVPYIALQLKAISDSVTLMVNHYDQINNTRETLPLDLSLIVTLTLAAFAILFGTRHADATEHQNGLMLSVALESVVKLAAFVIVGTAIVFFSFGGVGQIADAFANDPRVMQSIAAGTDGGTWLVLTLLSACAILVLPRQFHVTVVENRDKSEIDTAGWVFPLYLLLINLLVLPIAVSGLINLGDTLPADLYVLGLPLQSGNDALAMLAFLGGLSAATAMVIVACVALSVMISNDIIIPLIIWKTSARFHTNSGDWSRTILNIRRIAILFLMMAGFTYYTATADSTALASIGLLSFAALAQLAPALIVGLFWRGANARGAILGLTCGFTVWAFTLLVPTLIAGDAAILREGLFGISALRPHALFFMESDPLIHGVFWSLGVNVACLVLGSWTRNARPLERVQAISFVPRDSSQALDLKRFSTTVTVGEVKETVARYVGLDRMERAFAAFEVREARELDGKQPVDIPVVRYAEQILASAIGASSARLVLSLILEKDGVPSSVTIRLLDDASEALHKNRDVLQKALDQMDQGITVFDKDLRLSNWNTQFRRLFDLAPDMGQFGLPLKTIVDRLLEQKQISERDTRLIVENITTYKKAWQLPIANSGRIIEIRSNPMSDGGVVVTYSDITGRVEADAALRSAKESLELRVQQRTRELTNVNAELEAAQKTAEEANIGKTRFLAAAGHDITQPLNAARLYATSLVERMDMNDAVDISIARKIDSALESVETIIGAVLDISRLDAGALRPNATVFSLGDLLEQVRNEFQPMAERKDISLRIVRSSVLVKTDRNLLKRLLQNLVSNAIKYTKAGKVLVGVRRDGATIRLCVFDTGIGISDDKALSVFKEFERLRDGARIASGLGLGLSIVDRIARVLDLPLEMKSAPGHGTSFAIVIEPTSEALAIPAGRAQAALQPRAFLHNLVIACIDNDENILSGMRTLLEGWGARMVAATSEAELLAELDAVEEAPHAILADYHLDNNKTGLEAIAAARAKYGSSVPAFLITADRSLEVANEAAEADVTILNKPLKPAALRGHLASIPAQADIAAE